MKSEDATICEEVQLKVHKMTNNQMKNESLCIQTWTVIWNESSFNVSHQSAMTLKKQSD